MLKNLALRIVLLMLCLPPAVHAAEVAGLHFDEQVKFGPVGLTLNGAGLRSKFFIKVYAMGLYLPSKTADADQAINQAGPKRIQIVTLRDVGADMFVEGLTKGIEKNTRTSELAALKDRMEQLTTTLETLDELKKGSVVSLDQLPVGATRLSVNGSVVGQEIAGEDFYRALLHIWLGHKPAQDDLKQALLGR